MKGPEGDVKRKTAMGHMMVILVGEEVPGFVD